MLDSWHVMFHLAEDFVQKLNEIPLGPRNSMLNFRTESILMRIARSRFYLLKFLLPCSSAVAYIILTGIVAHVTLSSSTL